MAEVLKLVLKTVAPKAPRGLSKAAREEWDRTAPILRERGNLTPETEPLLKAYVGAIGLIGEIDREMAKASFRTVIKGGNGVPRAHPIIGARNRASQNALQFAKRLGILAGSAAPASSNSNSHADDYTDLGV